MRITSDWHIHSRNSDDEACMKVSDLIEQAADKGIVNFGLTDHFHTRDNMPDIIASRKEFLANNPHPRFHFGIEVSCVAQRKLDDAAAGLRDGAPADSRISIELTVEDINTLGVEYVVGGAHWPLFDFDNRDVVIQSFHRQNMFLATHPLVDIVAHPWWCMGPWKHSDGIHTIDAWFDDFRRIPRSMHDEFARAVTQHHKAVEINFDMFMTSDYTENFKSQYLGYLVYLKECGVSLAIGSDCHDADYNIDFEKAAVYWRAWALTTMSCGSYLQGLCDADITNS